LVHWKKDFLAKDTSGYFFSDYFFREQPQNILAIQDNESRDYFLFINKSKKSNFVFYLNKSIISEDEKTIDFAELDNFLSTNKVDYVVAYDATDEEKQKLNMRLEFVKEGKLDLNDIADLYVPKK
jgi:hypothetical protein